MGTKKVTAIQVANSLLLRGREENVDITPMKLQKLIYLVYREYYKRTKRALFNERFEVWKFGPVISTVHEAVKDFGANAVKGFIRESGQVYAVDEDKTEDVRHSLNLVWKTYGQQSAFALAEMLCSKNMAWRKAAEVHSMFITDTDILLEPEFV